MRKIIGTDRTVFLIGGLAIKLANIKALDSGNGRILCLVLGRAIGLRKNIGGLEGYSLRQAAYWWLYPLIQGVSANIYEFVYSFFGGKFLAKTYFSIGLINIQRGVDAIQFTHPDEYPFCKIFPLVKAYCEAFPALQVPVTHHLLASNYGWDSAGLLVIFDYGDREIWRFIRQHGKYLHSLSRQQTTSVPN